MTSKTLSALLVLLAGCARASGPADDPRIVTPLTVEPPPIYALLGYSELSLQSAQIAALDSIAEAVRERNAPLVDSLQSIGDRSRRGFFQVDERTEPILERIRESNRGAVESVREVLTDEQESATCRLFQQERERRRGERGGGRAGGERRGPGSPMLPDSVARRMGGALVWSWCATPPADRGAAAGGEAPRE